MRSIIKPAISLLAISGIAACLLGYVNAITAEPIAVAELDTIKASVKEVLPEVDNISENDIINVEDENTDVTQYIVAKNAAGDVIGYAISVTTNGFGSGLKLMYGIDTEGTITGLSVLDCSNETPGLGANIGTDASFREQFKGVSSDVAVVKDGGNVNAITGATITSRAVANATNTALKFYNEGGIN